MIAIGGTEVSDVRIGANAVGSVYVGSTKVHPSDPTMYGMWIDPSKNVYTWKDPDFQHPNGYWIYSSHGYSDDYHLFYKNSRWYVQIIKNGKITDEGFVELPANTRYIDRIETANHKVISGLTWYIS